MSVHPVKPIVAKESFPSRESFGRVFVVFDATPRLEEPFARRGDELPDRDEVPGLHVTTREAFVDVRPTDQTLDRHDATEPLVGLVPNALPDPVIVTEEASSRRHPDDGDHVPHVPRLLRHDGERKPR